MTIDSQRRVVEHEHLLIPCFTFVARVIVITIITSHFGDDVSVGGHDLTVTTAGQLDRSNSNCLLTCNLRNTLQNREALLDIMWDLIVSAVIVVRLHDVIVALHSASSPRFCTARFPGNPTPWLSLSHCIAAMDNPATIGTLVVVAVVVVVVVVLFSTVEEKNAEEEAKGRAERRVYFVFWACRFDS